MRTIGFGPFRLSPGERKIEKDGAPVPIGARALDILIALTERPGEVMSKTALLDRVWRGVAVDEGTLRFHVASLRKVLGDDGKARRYVINVAGRGYCFAAPVAGEGPAAVAGPAPAPIETAHGLPPRLARMVGRAEALGEIADLLLRTRFVTLVGPGGIGKTTLASAIGRELLDEFDGQVRFIDLGPQRDPLAAPTFLASALGVMAQGDPVLSLVSALHDRRLLLILDGCEHLIDAVAAVAERLTQEAEAVYVLATSREPLRVDGEHVRRLEALASPAETDGLTAASAMAFPAVQLFVERASASHGQFQLADSEAPLVGEICRRLDGLALAIELAAGRVGAYGVRETAAQLDSQFTLRWPGRRTAPDRHQTLNAAFDWSYDLLDAIEQGVLRRLAVFVGPFSLDAAIAVAADRTISAAEVIESASSVAAKSLLAIDARAGSVRYRLLDTARTYLQAKLQEDGRMDQIARRHADYFTRLLQAAGAGLPAIERPPAMAALAEHIGNVRAALDWCFSARGDGAMGVALTAAAAGTFIEEGLWNECHRWTTRAIAALDETVRGGALEAELLAAHGQAMMAVKGDSEDIRDAFLHALRLAESLDDPYLQLRVLGGLQMFLSRKADYREAEACAEQAAAAAARSGHPVALSLGHAGIAIASHFTGDQARTRGHVDAAFEHGEACPGLASLLYSYDRGVRLYVAHARALWLSGYPEQAEAAVRQTLARAEGLRASGALSLNSVWSVQVYFWLKDWDRAEAIADNVLSLTNRHPLTPYREIGLCLRGELLVRRGRPEEGLPLLRDYVAILHAERRLSLMPTLALVEGLMTTGQPEEAAAILLRAMAECERNGHLAYMPEMLRLRGELHLAESGEGSEAAGACFARALGMAEEQSALSWALRAAMSAARRQQARGRDDLALAELAPVYGRFTEGFDSADLREARRLIGALERGARGPAAQPIDVKR